MELARWTAMDYLTLILLSLGLSLDDFSLAFALSLLMPSVTFKKLIVNAGKIQAHSLYQPRYCLY
jgi:putative Mn2+ efflux pump MntP